MTGLILSLDDLAFLPQWVAWQTEIPADRDKPTKKPYSPTQARGASSTDPATWGAREDAERRASLLVKPFGLGGIGLTLGPIISDEFAGISLGGLDLDSCLDPATQRLQPWAQELVDRLDSYTETSPSGTGVKVFFSYETENADSVRQHFKRRADGTPNWGQKFSASNSAGHPEAIEAYIGERYFTITGKLWPTAPAELRCLSRDELLWIVTEACPAFEKQARAKANGAAGDHHTGRSESTETPPPPIDNERTQHLWRAIRKHANFSPLLYRRLSGDWQLKGTDQSRSARALSFARLTVGPLSLTFDDFRLVMHSHPEGFIRAWAQSQRELQRTYACALTDSIKGATPSNDNGQASGNASEDEAESGEVEEELALTDPTSLADIEPPPRTWIVEDWVPDGHATALYGDGGVGKSLLALQLQICSGTGNDWVGLTTTHCRSVGFYCEDDDDELHRRARSVCEAVGVSMRDLKECRWISRVGQDNVLVHFDPTGRMILTPIWYQLLNAALKFGARLVILDGAQDTFGGHENDRYQVRAFIQMACARIARAIGGAVLLLAHPSRDGLKTGKLDGGNTSWNNSVRSRITIGREAKAADADADPDQDVRVLSRAKSNYAAADEAIKIRWQNWAFTRDEGMTSTVRNIYRGNCERVFLKLLKRVTESGEWVSNSKHSPNYAPAIFSRRGDREGFSKSDFAAAMNALYEAGQIKTAEVKTPGRKVRDGIVACDQAPNHHDAAATSAEAA